MRNLITQSPLYPLRLEPIYQYRLWGGTRLAGMLNVPLPGDGLIGEAWILSDRPDHASLIADGPLKGKTLKQLTENEGRQLMGQLAGRFPRFPLLLKFLDVQERLSIQVHPPDTASSLIPNGETGKTEAWVVLENGPASLIYAGLKPGTTAADIRTAAGTGTIQELLATFIPQTGDAVLIPAGTIHSLNDIMVFEVQENSDVTFRLYDWDHVDPITGVKRPLQLDQALACVNFDQGSVEAKPPVIEAATPILREWLLYCEHFTVWRLQGESPFPVGAVDLPRVIVCLSGNGHLDYGDQEYPIKKGNVYLLPAAVGVCRLHPDGPIRVLEIALPEALPGK